MSDLFLIAHKGLHDRLIAKTYTCDDGCWHCEAGGENSRYGTIWHEGENIGNHVASWIVHKGPVPEGMFVLHTCDYKRCINPDHLFLGTHQDNIDDMMHKGRKSDRRGGYNHMAILDEEQVREIKYFLAHSGLTQQRIADHFGVSQVIISQINTGKRWSHVK